MAFAKLKTMAKAALNCEPRWSAFLAEYDLSPADVIVVENLHLKSMDDYIDCKHHVERMIGNCIQRCLFSFTGSRFVMGALDEQLRELIEYDVLDKRNYIVIDVKQNPKGDFRILGFTRGSCIAMSEVFFTATVPQLKAARKLLAQGK